MEYSPNHHLISMKALLILLLLPLLSSAQADSLGRIVDPIYQMPTYPGGDMAMMNFLKVNIKYPDAAKDCGCRGQIITRFSIDSTGTVTNATIFKTSIRCTTTLLNADNTSTTKDTTADCDKAVKQMEQECLRVVGLMPKWSPGIQDGKAVNVMFAIPVNFNM